MGDDDLDLLHAGHYREMTTDVATGLSRATVRSVAGHVIALADHGDEQALVAERVQCPLGGAVAHSVFLGQ